MELLASESSELLSLLMQHVSPDPLVPVRLGYDARILSDARSRGVAVDSSPSVGTRTRVARLRSRQAHCLSRPWMS